MKNIIAMVVLACTIAGRIYAGDNVNQVFKSHFNPIQNFQEQIFSQKVASNFEIIIPFEFDVTLFGETYHIVGTIYIGNERQYFVEIEIDIYHIDGDLQYHIRTTYNEEGERTGLIVTNPSGELIDDIPSEIYTIIDEVDNLATNALQNI